MVSPGWEGLPVRPAVAEVPLPPGVGPSLVLVRAARGRGVQSPVPRRAHQGQRGGPVDQLLQHLLAGDGQSSSLGGRGVSVALDGLRVGAPEDGREQAGAQRGEIWKQEPVMTMTHGEEGEEGDNN